MSSFNESLIFYLSLPDDADFYAYKEYREEMAFNISRRQQLEEEQEQQREEEESQAKNEKQQQEECKCQGSCGETSAKLAASMRELKARNDEDDDDDGFKTPTSSEYKIPEIKQCPPAPSKPKILSSSKTKRRKPSKSNLMRSLELHLFQQSDPLFQNPKLLKFYKKLKKCRSDAPNS